MLPIAVDVARLHVVLVGNGEATRRRLDLLGRAGARHVTVYSEVPEPGLAVAAGDRLCRRRPSERDIARAHLVFLAGVGEKERSRLRRIADGAGVLINVEDDIARSNFHSPAVVRRGDLSIAISTGGKSPGLAAALRRKIEAAFGPEWEVLLERAARLRTRWRGAGRDGAEIARLTAAWADRHSSP